MDRHTIELLELTVIRERLAGLCAFEGGADLARALEPTPDPRQVAALRDVTAEAVALWELAVSGPGGAHDIRDDVDDARRGSRLEVTALERVRATAEVAVELREAFTEHAEVAPILSEVADRIEAGALGRVATRLDACLDGRGGIRDDASSALARARRDIAELRRQAQEALREVAAEAKPHLQEGFITERGGRPVLAVKASSRSSVPGIVHDSSDSGGTLFVEPLAVVEASNRVREAVAREREELGVILGQLTALVDEHGYALDEATEALAHIDLCLARGSLSRAWRGAPVEEGEPLLVAARHPLLDPGTAVPIHLDLEGIRSLVVSGPNTGGKTVSLKTLGLFAMLHQCGLQPPADRVRLPVFDAVIADIGDDQSISESLSTFSAHVRTLIGVLDDAGARSLVLLDEVGAGTDPAEGAAIAQAVLGDLLDRGTLVLATTHSPEVKSWAVSTPGAANAAVGLDPDTLAPTYSLVVGEPGGSHAIGIAERLGMRFLTIRIDAQGRDADGRDVALPIAVAARPALLQEIFQTAQGAAPRLTEGEFGFAAMELRSVTPAALRPLESIRAQVNEAFLADARRRFQEQRAAAILAATRAGKPLAEAVAEAGARIEELGPFGREAGGGNPIPRELLPPIFELRLNEVSMIPAPLSFAVVQLTAITRPGLEGQEAALTTLRNETATALAGDLEAQFGAALRARSDVRFNLRLMNALSAE